MMNNIKKRYLVFIIGIIINALGNAMMLKGAIGAAPWTAAFDNVGKFLNVTPGVASIIISIVLFITSKLIGRDFNIKDGIITCCASLGFGYIVNFFLFLMGYNIPENMVIRIILGVAGVVITCLAVSITIQADVGYMATDDFLKNMKKHIFKGDVVLATLTSFIIALVLCVVCGLLSGGIINLTFVTLIICVTFGYIVKIFDHIVKIKFD